MNAKTRKVAVIGSNRIPFARSNGTYRHASNQDMLTAALDGLIDRFGLEGQRLGEVAGGAVLKHSRDRDLTRESVLGTRLAAETPAYDVQQACGTGLQAATAAANAIALGQYESAAAGGVDTASDAPIAFGDDLRHVLLGLRRAKPGSHRDDKNCYESEQTVHGKACSARVGQEKAVSRRSLPQTPALPTIRRVTLIRPASTPRNRRSRRGVFPGSAASHAGDRRPASR